MGERPNQRRRTRKDLLEAAGRLIKQGRTPTLEEVAEEALVSRATAYRYFPNAEALLAEASVDVAFPDAETLFAAVDAEDPTARLILADKAMHDLVLENEPQLRLMLAHSMQRIVRGETEGTPARQNRRGPFIEAALKPVQDEFSPQALDDLVKALSILIGTESMVVTKDVLQLDDGEARRIMAWAIGALVEAARRR